MFQNGKLLVVASLLLVIGFCAAWNAKWVREGLSPWWTSYIVSFFTASIYAYLARHPFFPLTYTSVFQSFFFHGAWYTTTIFIIGENLPPHKLFGLALAFAGFLTMSI